jgi:hypothetical protein
VARHNSAGMVLEYVPQVHVEDTGALVRLISRPIVLVLGDPDQLDPFH